MKFLRLSLGREYDVKARLDPTAAAERRTSHGGTAWSEVERQVKLLRATLP